MAPGIAESQCPTGPAAPRESGLRRWPLAYAASAAVATVVASAGNTFRLNGIAAWIAAVGFWLYAWWPRGGPLFPNADERHHRPRVWVVVLLSIIIACGVFFRFHRIAETPMDPTSDHAEKLLDVQDVLDGQRPIFFIRNTGREPAQFYVIAGMVQWLGLPPTFDTMKLGTAAIDVLTIPAVYLLAAELGGPVVGLAAAAAYSFAAWPVGIARAGLRFPYAPLPATLALWLLFRYLRRGDRRDALLLGATLGVGLYGYSPFRVVIPIIPLALGLTWLLETRWHPWRRRLLQDGLLMGATMLIVFIPLGRYMLEHPEAFWYRAASRAVGDHLESPLTFEALRVFAMNNLMAALAFNVRGDSSMVNAERWAPFLDTASGAAFLLGTLLAVRMVVAERNVRWLILLASFPILFLSSTLAISFPIENPSVNRAGPVLPVAFALVGLGAGRLALIAFQHGQRSTRVLSGVVLLGGLALAVPENYERYFVRFDMQYRDFVWNTKEIARAVRPELGQGLTLDRVYAMEWPYWFDTRNLGIMLGDIRWAERHTLTERQPIPDPGQGNLLLIIHPDDRRRIEEINRRFPGASVRRISAEQPGKDFVLARVPTSSAGR